MTQRTALYARVSTTRQQEERTVASQLAALEKAAEGMGLVVAAEHRYVDEGYSGSRLDRPGLDALRDAAADGLLDMVLVYAPDRLARNYVHQQIVLEELGKRGIQVHFLERPVSQKPEDLLLVRMQGVIAEYERAKILERTRRGRLHKVRAPDQVEQRFRGKWNTDSGASGTPIPAMWNTDSGQVERTRQVGSRMGDTVER